MQPTPELPMPIDRFRRYDLVAKSYSGWYRGKKMSRKLFAQVSGISVQCLKFHDHNPGARMKPHILARLAKLEREVGAQNQCDMIDRKAEQAAARVTAKAAAARERERDKALDKALARCRPLPKRARQQAIF